MLASVASRVLLALLGACLLTVAAANGNGYSIFGNLDNNAVCDVLQLDGFYNTQKGVQNFQTYNWGRVNAALQFCQDSYRPQHVDQCAYQCSTTHTLTLSVFSKFHTFNLLINGYILTARGWVALPYGHPRGQAATTYGGWPSNSTVFGDGELTDAYTPLDVGYSSNYSTGQWNSIGSPAPNNYVQWIGEIIAEAILGQPLGLAPIYKVTFPYWNCQASSLMDPVSGSNTIKNYVSVNVKWQLGSSTVCGQPNGQDFVFTRNCSVTTGNTSASSTSQLLGDPQFAGLRGQDYQVHGIDGGIYNIISDKYMQLNSKFVFLRGPRPCPTIPSTGKKSVACFHHAGSYLGNLALLTDNDARVFIESGPAERGLATVELNGERLIMGDNVTLTLADGRQGYVHYLSTHEVVLVVGLFEIEIENSDSFLNLRSALVRSDNWQELVDEKAHGLLGQTWQVRKGKSAIEGKVDDYLLLSDDLYGSDFEFNRFGLTAEAETQS